MTNDVLNPSQALKQKYFLVSKKGTVIFVILAVLFYIFMVFKAGWENQPIYSKSPYKWDKKGAEVCAKNKGLPEVDKSKLPFDLGAFAFKPVARYGHSSVFDTNPECIGYSLRQGLYGGETGSFRNIYVNRNNEKVAEIIVLYTDNKDE
jgi:hypothetical protein